LIEFNFPWIITDRIPEYFKELIKIIKQIINIIVYSAILKRLKENVLVENVNIQQPFFIDINVLTTQIVEAKAIDLNILNH